jgi:hypothetical protein
MNMALLGVIRCWLMPEGLSVHEVARRTHLPRNIITPKLGVCEAGSSSL